MSPSPYLNESIIETAALDWFADLGYTALHDEDIRPGAPHAERDALNQVILVDRLRTRLTRLNPLLNAPAVEELVRRITTIHDSPSLVHNNHTFHKMLVEGVKVPVTQRDGAIRHFHARIADLDDPESNDWLVVQQFTIRDGAHKRRPDLLVFLNGIPIANLELKNPGDEQATVAAAYRQLQTYKDELPTLNTYNELLVASDGITARVGSLTASSEWFLPWRTVAGQEASPLEIELEVLIRGLFNRHRLLTYLRHFIVFDEAPNGKLTKIIAGYHQYYAVNTALEHTIRATTPKVADSRGRYTVTPASETDETLGDRRIGVIWHTQGSGKSLTMTFYAGRVIQDERMRNPTILVLTDRNDLDNQLFSTFARCQDLLFQPPQQANSRADLRQLLNREAGGVIFTTVQKFMPEEKGDAFPTLSTRTNVVVVADEAHRSQYDFIDGFARHIHDALPNAAFIGFTGTPIESSDISTRNVFGDYISTYDIQRAVADKATVPIYYEGRVAKLHLSADQRPLLDDAFDELTEAQEQEGRERLKTKWAALEALVGAPNRIDQIAADLVDHFERRQDAITGKAMIVCMSRRICVDLYDAIALLRPDWCQDDDALGKAKIIMTGSATDPVPWQKHIRNKQTRDDMARRFKNPDDPFQIVIVRDMWLTGFDAPCLHTMYIDKPMRGHGLMQAIARVNRVFRDKPGGLVVDYLGLADQLQRALGIYTASGGTGKTALNQEEAVALVKREHEVCSDFFHGFDWSAWRTGPAQAKIRLFPAALQHITAQTDDRRKQFITAVTTLSKAFALSVPHPEALALRDDIAFFQQLKAILVKPTLEREHSADTLEHAVNQLLSEAIIADQVVDIFSAAGIPKPDISILSDEFLKNIKEMPQRDLAVELLRKLLNGEIRNLARKNTVQSRSFTAMLEQSMNAYHNRTVTTYQVIDELIAMARQMREQTDRGQKLGLSDEEVAFYDALETSESAVQVMEDETLMTIARELVKIVHANATIDWEIRDSVRARLRLAIKKILKRYGYPPDLREKAAETVLMQAELNAHAWVAA